MKKSITTNPERLITALSKAERRVLFQISNSKTTQEIALDLELSTSTIKNHRHGICKKLQLQPINNSLLTFALEHKEKIKKINSI